MDPNSNMNPMDPITFYTSLYKLHTSWKQKYHTQNKQWVQKRETDNFRYAMYVYVATK